MLDDRAHPSEGGLEGREPIGRLFRDIEENICAVHDSLLLRWGFPSDQRADLEDGVGSTHIDFDPDRPWRLRISSDLVSETCLHFRSMCAVAGVSEMVIAISSSKVTRPGTATIFGQLAPVREPIHSCLSVTIECRRSDQSTEYARHSTVRVRASGRVVHLSSPFFKFLSDQRTTGLYNSESRQHHNAHRRAFSVPQDRADPFHSNNSGGQHSRTHVHGWSLTSLVTCASSPVTLCATPIGGTIGCTFSACSRGIPSVVERLPESHFIITSQAGFDQSYLSRARSTDLTSHQQPSYQQISLIR